MKKGLIKALCITALVAVAGVGGLALGAEISNGFETSYSESAYENYGNEQQQIGFDQGKQEGLEEGYQNGQQAGYDEGYNTGQNVGYENGYTDGEKAGYDSGFEAGLANGFTEEDIQNAKEEAYQEKDDEYNELIKFFAGGTRTRYESDTYELLTSTSGLEGVILHDKLTDSYQKIINTGTNFNIWKDLHDTYVIISGSDTTEGLYFFNKENGNLITFSENKQWSANSFKYIYPDNKNMLITPATDTNDDSILGDGVYYFNVEALTFEKILSGKYFSVSAYNKKDGDVLVAYISSRSEDELGLYTFDVENEELKTLTSEGYGYIVEFYNVGNKEVITCALGLVEILPDTSINILISTNGGIDSWCTIYNDLAWTNENKLYRYNHETESYDYINPNIEVTNIIPEAGYDIFIFDNNESKFVVYSVSGDEVFSINLEFNIQFGQIFDYNFGEGGNNMTIEALPLGEYGSFKTYFADFDNGTFEEVVE